VTGHWVATWAAAPQPAGPDAMPPPPFTRGRLVLADSTLRQSVRVSIGGGRIRLRFSNVFGGADLPIARAHVARPLAGRAGESAIQPGTGAAVTFGGRPAAALPAGAQVVSDPLDYPLAAGMNVTVTIYLAAGQASGRITSHPGSRTTSHLLAGNHAGAHDLPGATPVDHWYFLTGIDVWSPVTTASVVILGDSLTDGRGSTTNGNDRWPDLLFNRLRAVPDAAGTALVNQALGGNHVLRDGLGPPILARLERDALAISGMRGLIVFAGVNDIGTAGATDAAQRRVTADLIAAFGQVVTRARAYRPALRVYGATLTPFGGNEAYDDPRGCRDMSRQAVNGWIRAGHRFDAVLDFDRVVRDRGHPRHLTPAADCGDHLHLNPAGYQALADAVPLSLFGRWP
jgi:lysophospholipase L1-like esterase